MNQQNQPEIEYCTVYHCAGDCGQPHNQKEMQEFLTSQPQQEPVVLPCCGFADASAIKWNPYNQAVQCHNCGQVYAAPQPTQRKPLTDEEIERIAARTLFPITFARAIEAAHGIKGDA